MAFDLRECMGSDGVSVGLTGFRLWGFVGILVRRPDSGLHRLPAVPVGMVSQSGGPAGQRSSRRHKWPGRCGDGFTPRRTVVPHLAFARCRRRAGGRFRMHRKNLPGCTRSLIRSGSPGYAAMGGSS